MLPELLKLHLKRIGISSLHACDELVQTPDDLLQVLHLLNQVQSQKTTLRTKLEADFSYGHPWD